MDEFETLFGGRVCEVGTGEVLEDSSDSGKKRDWEGKKKLSLQMVELYEAALEVDESLMSFSRLNDMRDCASYLVFGRAEGKQKLVEANFCKVRLCPMCNWRKSLKMFAQVSKITDVMMAENKVRFIFLTLTVQNPVAKDLIPTLDRMNAAFRYLVQKKQTFAPAKKLKENLMGYLKAIEITYNSREDTYHPHIHALLAVRPNYFKNGYVKQAEYTEMWKQAMHLDYDPLVDVRIIRNATSRTIAEMSKYPTKIANLLSLRDKRQAVKALITLHHAMFNRQLVTFGGLFRDIRRRLKLDDIENGSLVHVETDEQELNNVAYVLFKYQKGCGLYVC